MEVLSKGMIHKTTESYHSISTDSSGSFEFSYIDGGRKCSDVTLFFEKAGYKSDTIIFSADTVGAVVKLGK